MSIKLEYILSRNRTNLKTFIDKNTLTTYEKLVEYCDYRGFFPCDEETYSKVVGKSEKVNERKVRRKTSGTQKPKKTRNSRKKQQSTSKLPDSTDKR